MQTPKKQTNSKNAKNFEKIKKNVYKLNIFTMFIDYIQKNS